MKAPDPPHARSIVAASAVATAQLPVVPPQFPPVSTQVTKIAIEIAPGSAHRVGRGM